VAIQCPASGVVGNDIYLVGGATDSEVVNINQIYDTATNKWTTGAPMPTARFCPAGAVVNNILYVIGGKYNGNQLSTVEAYDPATNKWSTNHAPMPGARDSIKAVVFGGIIYVIGGYSNSDDRLNTVQSYDPATNKWTTRDSLPVGKSSVAAGLLGSTIVAAAGLEDSGATGNNEALSAASPGSWKSLASDPTARWAGCSASIAGILYYAGGRTNADPVHVVESFDLTTNEWSTLASIPTAVVNPAEAEVGNLMYCIGGSSNGQLDQGTVYDNVQIYHP